MRVFEHCEAYLAPCGGVTVTRSMKRVANATRYRFSARRGPSARARRGRAAPADKARQGVRGHITIFFFWAGEAHIDKRGDRLIQRASMASRLAVY